MAQPASLDQNLPDLGGPFLYQDQDGEKASYSLETPYGFLLDLDFLKYVDDIERGQTLRKVALSRKAKAAGPGRASPREPAGGWTSTESLSSVASDDGKAPFSPRPKAWSGSGQTKQPSAPLSPSPVLRLLPPPASKSLLRNTRVEKTLLETSKRLEEQQLNLDAARTSLFSVVPSSPSKTAGASAPASDSILEDANMPGKTSPSNSGRSTPAPALTPAHLQHVREQMAAALKQLKGLEEQVKVIPVLEETICRLTKEKEELAAGRQEKPDAGENEAQVFRFPPRSPGAGVVVRMEEGSQGGGDDGAFAKMRPSKIAGLKKLTEKLSSAEKGGKVGRGASGPRKASEATCRSVGVGEDVDMKEAVFYYRCQKPCREVGVGRATETREASVWVMESLLGVSSEAEAEMALLRETVQHQKGVITVLEQHLKEAADEMEELRLEVCARIPRELASRETLARPETADVSTEAIPPTQSQGVGSHVETSDVAVHCSPHVACVGVCCDLPQDGRWSLAGRDKAVQVDLVEESEASRGGTEAGPVQKASRWEGAETGMVSGSSEEDLCAEQLVHQETLRSELEAPLNTQMEEEDGVDPQLESGKRPPQRAGAGGLKSIMKKQDGLAKGEAGSGRKVLQFVGVLNGEYESTSSEEEEEARDEGSPEKTSPFSSDTEGSADTSGDDLAADLEGPKNDPEGEEGPTCDLEVPQDGRGSPKAAASEGVKEKFELDPRMREACFVLKSHLTRGRGASDGKEVLSRTSFVLQQWFRLSSQKKSLAGEVADHLQAFSEISPGLLAHVINLSDGNGNTALHYSVSHSNFDIVQLLLDTGVCNVNHQNKAGYTALMLAALAAVEQEEEMATVRRLFSMGNINAKASQAGQTALMLAVSHGRQEMVEALLACGADINLQDEEGSNALMCACEHGRAGTVRLLLSRPGCDVSAVDNDGNDAVSIALEAGHRDIAALISTHLTQSGAGPPDASRTPPSKKPL